MSASPSNYSLTEKFTVRLEMLSDWHIGTGAGIPGNIDALIARDNEGFPCIPAKTVVGIWRDAMERLVYGLDGGSNNKGSWAMWVEVIFGSQPNVDKIPDVKPRPAILSLQPARISQGLRETINSKNDIRLKQALTLIKPEIKIDEESGTAETEKLRFAEMGRIGTILETDCRLNFEILENVTEAHKQAISALLIASAKLVERIGGKRRRGSGKCELVIVNSKITGEIIKQLSEPALNAPPLKEIAKDDEFAAPDSDTKWRKLDYTLTLRTPVAIVTATLGNVSETLDFIPGTYLLPHVTKGKNLFKHIANGDVQVSPATIEVNGERGLPVPKVIYYDKVGGGFDKDKSGRATVYNLFSDADRKKIEGGDQKKNYRDGYLSSLDENNGKLPFRAITPKTLLMHNTVNDDSQRPDETVGGVYSRQAIAATINKDGKIQTTVLRGEIRFKESLNLNFSDVAREIRLGTSKKDDYGLAQIEFHSPQNHNSNASHYGSTLFVYLESDVLLRNANLRQTNLADDLARGICQKLNEGLADDSKKVCLKTSKSLIQTRRVESWHEGWGLPRPTLIAMQAGSCLEFTVTGKIDDSKIQKLEIEGIGERRGEGYGRIRFNPKLLTHEISGWILAKETNSDKSRDDELQSVETEMKFFAEQIETIAWREELRRTVLLIAEDEKQREKIFGFEKGGKPSTNQIGGLRSVISRMQKFDDGKSVVSWLEHLKETKNRLEKWGQSEQEAKVKLKRIEDLMVQDGKVWLILSETKIDDKNVWEYPPVLVRTKEELQKEFWAEAVRALFDACMRSHKREGGES